MKLVIVESPTKAKTLNKYLGKEYKVVASYGHIRDLPTKEMGVDIEKNYEPKYETPDKPRVKKAISEIKKEAKDADSIVLATDPDREGEAIAWHLQEILKKDKKLKKDVPYERIVFHEITKEALSEAFKHPGKVNLDLVDAQQARRVLDRLVGYRLSPLLWKKVRFGLSAGRVQSVAVRLIVEKERERDAFKPEEYWSVDVDFENKAKDLVKAALSKKNGKKVEIDNEKDAKEIEKDLNGDSFKVGSVNRSERQRTAPTPFRTSTLQQAASNVYGFTAKRTMTAAQKLFEQGLITYHRTDSLNLSPQFVDEARSFISKELGKNFIPDTPNVYKTSAKGAQEAHEAIRPTNIKADLAKLKEDEVKVYRLILTRTLESQMVPAVYDQTKVVINSEKGYEFTANGSVIKFDGWLAVGKLFGFKDTENGINKIADVSEGELMIAKKINLGQHFTQPPARYSDATLIKALEEMGIGRPSTYAPTITTIQARKYIRKEGRYFVPEDVAYVVTDLLVGYFPGVTDYEFTANMEEKFDEIAEGELEWVPVIDEFFKPFEKQVAKADKELSKQDVTKLGESEEKCPECGKVLYVKLGKFGKFLSCSGFPECEYARPMEDDLVDENGAAKTFGKCDVCGEGDMTLKQGRYGKFLACNRYPKCKNTKPYLDKIGVPCPKCAEEDRANGEMVIKKAKGRNFFGCSNYPDCDYASWKDPRLGKKKDDSEESAEEVSEESLESLADQE